MIRVCKAAAVVIGVGVLVVLFCGFVAPQNRDNPIIPRMPSFRGEIFTGYTELRLQNITVDGFGVIAFNGEPFEALVNVDYISMVHRYEDFKETDHSCMLYFKDKETPFLVRQEYKDVLSSIRRASDK